jgi:hypothetical protein
MPLGFHPKVYQDNGAGGRNAVSITCAVVQVTFKPGKVQDLLINPLLGYKFSTYISYIILVNSSNGLSLLLVYIYIISFY